MKKQLLLLLIIVFSAGLANAQSGAANSGKKMTFQGSLFENGEPYNGTSDLSFSIDLGTTQPWSEVHVSVPVANGLYSVVLGSINPLPSTLFQDANERTVIVKVGNVTLGQVKLYEPFSAAFPDTLSNNVDLSNRPTLLISQSGSNGARAASLEAYSNADSTAFGIYAEANGSGNNYGIYGFAKSTSGSARGVVGAVDVSENPSSSFDIGVSAQVYGTLTDSATFSVGAYGQNTVQGGSEAWGTGGFAGGQGINRAFRGRANSTSGMTAPQYGAWLQANGAGTGDSYGSWSRAAGAGRNIGVYGTAGGGTENWAGWFDGDLYISGQLIADGGVPVDYRSKEFILENEWDDRQVGNMKSFANGGQLNIGGINETSDTTSSQGGGISTGGKFWESTPQLGYFHLRGTVNDANFFGANMKFSLEAMKDDFAEEAEFKMFGSELDENAATKVVLRMNTIRNEQGQSASEITGMGSFTENFKLGAKVWETAGTELPYLAFKGTATGSFNNDNGTPEDTTDDFTDQGLKDLIWMDVQKWQDGSEVGNLTLRGSDGSEFSINSHGIDPNSKFDRIDMQDSLERKAVSLFPRVEGGGSLFFPSVTDEFVYNWIQNRVRPDGSAAGSAQVANIASDGSYVTGTGMSGGFFYIDSWANERFYTNVELGLTQEANKLPYLNLRGSEILNWFDDKGTADSTDDTSGTYLPDLISMRVTRQEDGTELGNFILRGTDGSEFGISSHGITQTIDYRSKEFVLENQADNRRVGNMLSNSNGGQLNIGGIIETSDSTSSQGGGISIGSKFWEGNPHLGYFHLRGTVNDANFNANMKFSLEAMKDDVAEEAEFKMFGSELDENAATKVVLRMNTIRNEQGQSASEITGLGSYTENFKIGAKVWETDGTELPYLSMKGTASAPYYNDGGTPNDSTDDDSGEYTKDLIWMDAQKWEDGSERGHISLNGTNGFYHNMTDWISEIKNESGDGTYSQQRSNIFRVKNDSDPYSSVFLTRGSNGNAFLQLASHNNGESRGVLNIGSDNDGPYLSMAAADGKVRFVLIVNDDSGASMTLRGANDINGSETDSLGNPIPMRPQLAQMRVEIDSASGDETGAIYVSNASGENTISLIGSTGNINIAGTLTQNSDARLKKDVNTLEGALKNVSKMRGVSYHWKDDSRTTDKQIGVIAQEVEAVYPEFVAEDKDGTKSVNYAQMTAVLIEAVKELNAEITSLKETNATLKAEVSNAKHLEDRLLQIEKLLGVKTNNTANANK